MAEAPRSHLPSGYDEDFVNEFEDDFQCLICLLPQKAPVLTSCGHRFCEQCLKEHFRRQEGQTLTCPVDMQELDRERDIFLDKATERKILSLIIKCPSDGCEWTGELRYKKTHLASCPFKNVPCTNENCLVTLKRKDLGEHVAVTCEWRIIMCEYCSESHPKCRMEDHIREKCKLCTLPCPYMCGTLTVKKLDLQDHFETCQRFPVRCPNNCEAEIAREMIQSHIEDDCPLTKIPCPYARMGCHTEVQRDQLESHLQHQARLHLDKVKKKTVQLDRQEATQRTFQNKHDRLEKRLEETVDVLQQQHQNRVNVLQQEYQEKLRILKLELEEKVNTTQTKLEQKLSKERKIFFVCLLLSLLGYLILYLGLEDKLNSLNTHLRVTEESRTFTWKITSFASKLKQAKNKVNKAIGSDPFYMYGYKLRLQLFPNGNGDGENTHLSVFIYVMQGEYDAILPWPFKKKVKFTLIDQHEDLAKREKVTFEFISEDCRECFARPTQKMDIFGWGFPQFISHEKLNSRRYIVDDTAFLQVEVGPSSWF